MLKDFNTTTRRNVKVYDESIDGGDTPRAKFIRRIITSKTGEVLSDEESIIKKNVGGFVISYSDRVLDFLMNCDAPSAIRIFFYLAHKQQYGNVDNQYGYRCQKNDLASSLNIDRRSVYRGLDYLTRNLMVHELRLQNCYEYMVNPYFVTIGKDRDKRLAVWNKRWASTPAKSLTRSDENAQRGNG